MLIFFQDLELITFTECDEEVPSYRKGAVSLNQNLIVFSVSDDSHNSLDLKPSTMRGLQADEEQVCNVFCLYSTYIKCTGGSKESRATSGDQGTALSQCQAAGFKCR